MCERGCARECGSDVAGRGNSLAQACASSAPCSPGTGTVLQGLWGEAIRRRPDTVVLLKSESGARCDMTAWRAGLRVAASDEPARTTITCERSCCRDVLKASG
jgi:hypothetical protein